MRKVIMTAVGLAILTGAFVMLWLQGPISEGIFVTWIGGVLGLLGVYTEGNVRSKKAYVESKKTDSGTMGITG